MLTTLAVVAIVVPLATVSAAAFTARSPFCVSCHEMQDYYDSWQRSPHRDVACVKCHLPDNPAEYFKEKLSAFREIYVHFNGEVQAPLGVTRDIPQENCIGCHEDLPARVEDNTRFDHSRHEQACLDCHARLVHRTLGSPEYRDPNNMDTCLECHDGTSADDSCATCHMAPHPRIGTGPESEACNTCHVADSWTPELFEHPVSLQENHTEAGCVDCHGEVADVDGSSILGKAPIDCASCHRPPHPIMGPCADCHSPQGWLPSTFAHPIELVGRHQEAACGGCHSKSAGADGSTLLGDAPTECARCHEVPHLGMGPCDRCHTPSGWLPSTFEHPYTLVGAHGRAECTECHGESGGDLGQAPATCASCHRAPHYGMGSCDRCHTPAGWSPPSFKHPFPLTGRHADLGCTECHRITSGTLAKASASCSSCHRSPHVGPSYCSKCHSTSGWSPQTFRHRQVGEHVPNGEIRLACSQCHPTGFSSTSCSPCHSGRGGGGGDD